MRRQVAVHVILDQKGFAREQAVVRKNGPVAGAGTVKQAAAVEDEVAEVREAAEEAAHVGDADAGGREVE